MLKLRSLLPVLVLLLFAVAAHTQETPAQAGKNAGAGSGSGSGTGSGIAVSESRSGVGAVSGVAASYIGSSFSGTKGQPFSADVIDETDQFLADGNHIHRESHGKLFRDSEGRTRTETELGVGRTVDGEPFIHITIMDPVQHQMIVLEPRQKQAIVHTMGIVTGLGGAVPIRPGTPGNLTAPSPPPPPATGTPAATGALVESLRVIREGQTSTSTRHVARSEREDLGTSTMEGFTVTGTRFTHTIPAGERGNDKPMTATSESWFSPDLGVQLLAKSENPETGQHTHKLVNIRAGEPDPLLFQVPAEYTVREQPQR